MASVQTLPRFIFASPHQAMTTAGPPKMRHKQQRAALPEAFAATACHPGPDHDLAVLHAQSATSSDVHDAMEGLMMLPEAPRDTPVQTPNQRRLARQFLLRPTAAATACHLMFPPTSPVSALCYQ